MKENALQILGIDIGASSGRVISAKISKTKLSLTEIHRFPNNMVKINGHFHWDVFNLLNEIKTGLKISRNKGYKIASLGIDTWGVDYGLFDKNDNMLGLPFAYRDSRTTGIMEKVFKKIPKKKIYDITGIQFLPFNTIFQLYAQKISDSATLSRAKYFLMMPELFTNLLTGEKFAEFTNATTSQLVDAEKRYWSKLICNKLGIPFNLFPSIVNSGTIIGNLKQKIANEVGFDCSVIAPACHDTASAIAAVPADTKNWAYISSGTWSLIGIETKKPIISNNALSSNFTNEGGVEGTYRFLKNVSGLWLIQECQKLWNLDFSKICNLAKESNPFRSLIDPDDASFITPGNTIDKIQQFCKKTRQPVPKSIGEISRCIFESLALKYRYIIDEISAIQKHRIELIHIVGGGSKNKILCQMTADATGLPVIAGPSEATAIGNILMQAISLKKIRSLKEARQLVKNSFGIRKFTPASSAIWNKTYINFKNNFIGLS